MTHRFVVEHAFSAIDPISGRERKLGPGDTLVCNIGQTGGTIIAEIDGLPFLVERSQMESCCTIKYESGPL